MFQIIILCNFIRQTLLIKTLTVDNRMFERLGVNHLITYQYLPNLCNRPHMHLLTTLLIGQYFHLPGWSSWIPLRPASLPHGGGGGCVAHLKASSASTHEAHQSCLLTVSIRTTAMDRQLRALIRFCVRLSPLLRTLTVYNNRFIWEKEKGSFSGVLFSECWGDAAGIIGVVLWGACVWVRVLFVPDVFAVRAGHVRVPGCSRASTGRGMTARGPGRLHRPFSPYAAFKKTHCAHLAHICTKPCLICFCE